ncbi:MAG TPA: hypothetical protein VFR85_16085 [Anaeromyxobacteraceae bacterium]|nr:hypothetical protein [Anaeromyxobacteraceae bacterium]
MRTQGAPAAIAVAMAALGLVACDTAGLAPIDWQKVPGPGPGGSILGFGAPGTFDERGNFTIRAFRDGDVIRLYYGGSDATGDPACPGMNGSRWRIGLAESTDGVSFTRVQGTETGGAIVDNGAPGQFDSLLTYRPYVLKDGATYRMWFNGATLPFNCPTGTLGKDRRIGYAESEDGVHWTKHYDGAGPGGSVLPLGAPGELDAQQVGYAWIMKDGAEYKMFYSANDASNFWRVGLAVSTDARTWTKVRGDTATGAILDLGPPGSFDAACAYQPSVVKERELYRMWYRGCEAPGPFGGPSRGSIGYAESNDGISWRRVPQPGFGGAALGTGSAGSFDSFGLTSPSVFVDGSTWVMYYAGIDTTGVYLTGLARGPR